MALPSTEAVKQNDGAFLLHKQGRYAESAAGFGEAVRLSPGFLLAHYNLACALARTGDYAGALRELTFVFTRDLLDVADRARFAIQISQPSSGRAKEPRRANS